MRSISRHARQILSITIVSSIFGVGCASTRSDKQSDKQPDSLPAPALYAPADLIEPFVPPGEPVDSSKITSLTLDQILIYADANAPSIATARAHVGIADADLTSARIVFPANPELGFAAGARTVGGSSGFVFEVAIEQTLKFAGEQALRVETARHFQQLARATVNEVRWNVHVEAHRLFVDLLLVRERLAQAEQFVVFAQSMRDIAARQIEAGEAAPLILFVADADLAQTRAAVIQARQLQAVLQTRLAAIIGWKDNSLPPVEGDLPPVRSAPETQQLLQLMAENHPSLRAREIAVLAENSRLRLEDRKAWPEPTIGASYEHEAAAGSELAANTWLLSISMPIPIFLTNQGQRAAAQASIQLADRQRSQTAIQLQSDLQQAAIAMNAAAELVAIHESSIVPQIEEKLALILRAYELGEVDVLQVSQTRERLLNANAQYIDARVTYYETAATLEGLVGTELWPNTSELP